MAGGRDSAAVRAQRIVSARLVRLDTGATGKAGDIGPHLEAVGDPRALGQRQAIFHVVLDLSRRTVVLRFQQHNNHVIRQDNIATERPQWVV